MSNIVTPSYNKANFSSPNAYKKAHQAASHIAAKAGLYPASFSDLVKVEEGDDPRYKSIAIQTQYIMQNGKAMSRAQVKKLRKQLGLS